MVSPTEPEADWHRRVIDRSLQAATARSIDRGRTLIAAAATVLERSGGADITVQDVADEAGQSLRTLYQYFESKDDLLLAVFEEAMRTYARLVRSAITDLDDPLDRLAGALVAAQSMVAYSSPGFDRGLARLRLRLSEVEPDQIARAQGALVSLVRELVADAADAGRIACDDPEPPTFLLVSVTSATIMAQRLGNDAGVSPPDPRDTVLFCLQGLGARMGRRELGRVRARLRFPQESR